MSRETRVHLGKWWAEPRRIRLLPQIYQKNRPSFQHSPWKDLERRTILGGVRGKKTFLRQKDWGQRRFSSSQSAWDNLIIEDEILRLTRRMVPSPVRLVAVIAADGGCSCFGVSIHFRFLDWFRVVFLRQEMILRTSHIISRHLRTQTLRTVIFTLTNRKNIKIYECYYVRVSHRKLFAD